MKNKKTQYTPKKNQQRPSRVLLVCIYDTIVFQISNEMVYQKFQEYGPIIRILIFQKKQITKLFIQYDQQQSAVKAKNQLDGTKLCQSICKMSIYYSTLESVDLKHQSTQGFSSQSNDYDLVQYAVSLTNSNYSPGYFSPINEYNAMKHSNTDTYDYNQYFLPRSKTDNIDLRHHLERTQKNIWDIHLDIDETIKYDIDSILNEQDGNNSQNMSISNNDSPGKIPKLKNSQFSHQVSILGFKTNQFIKPIFIYNLFSNFGNVSRIASSQGQVKIKFRTNQFAAIAKNYLTDLCIYDCCMQLYKVSSNSFLPQQDQYSQLVTFDSTSDRFTEKRSITINPPSKVLHISGMKKQTCCIPELKRIFMNICQPTKIKILKQSYQKNMALVKFMDLETSLRVIAQCHNMVVGTRKIQISFTKSQI